MTLFQSLSSESARGRRPSASSAGGRSREFEGHPDDNDDNNNNEEEEEWDEVTTGEQGCWAEHARASAKSRGKLDVKSYIPACTQEGKFEAVQCYEASGYCWCVEEESGRPISGTSTRNGEPDCQSSGGGQRQKEEEEEMEASWFRCPDDKRAAFRKDVMRYMEREMVRAGQEEEEDGQSAADWKFQQLDKDQNGVSDFSL